MRINHIINLRGQNILKNLKKATRLVILHTIDKIYTLVDTLVILKAFCVFFFLKHFYWNAKLLLTFPSAFSCDSRNTNSQRDAGSCSTITHFPSYFERVQVYISHYASAIWVLPVSSEKIADERYKIRLMSLWKPYNNTLATLNCGASEVHIYPRTMVNFALISIFFYRSVLP